jgi:ABC-2 type transport system ATP-binding protein
MLDKGRIVFDGSLLDIQRRFGYGRVIHLILSEEQSQTLELAADALSDFPAISISRPEPYKLSVQFNANQVTASTLVARLLAVLPVKDLSIEEPGIEGIIRQLYEGTLQFAEVESHHDN